MAHAQRGTSGRRGRGHIDVSGAEPVAGAASGGQGETDRQRAIRAGSRRRARARAADRHGGATDKLDGGRTEKASGLRRHGEKFYTPIYSPPWRAERDKEEYQVSTQM